MECIFSFLCLFLEIEHLKNKSMFLSLFLCFSSCRDLFLRAASTDSSHLSFALTLAVLMLSPFCCRQCWTACGHYCSHWSSGQRKVVYIGIAFVPCCPSCFYVMRRYIEFYIGVE